MTDYQLIESTNDLDAVFEHSAERPVVIFKHSLTCPVSKAALNEYERHLRKEGKDEVAYHLIEIQRHRDLSAAVEERTAVKHESPQAIVLVDGEPTWHASHWKITAEDLSDALFMETESESEKASKEG